MSESLENLSHYIRKSFHSCVRGRLVLPEIEGDFTDFPASMHPLLKKALTDLGVEKLYSHQKESFESVKSGNNTILLSRTASGKTFSFLLPILDDYAERPGKFTTLLLYPTKALSRDQESALGKVLKSVSGDAKFGVFDGDTAREDRDSLVKYADFILSNPDMLHSGILPNHSRKWRNFLSRLKYIVVDESHIYRGAFGSHVSNVMKRLIRICQNYGTDPIFICSTASIGNPAEHAKALFHKEFNLISNDGSPRAEKEILFLNPSLVSRNGGPEYRQGPASISIPVICEAARMGIRTICFARARQEVERLYKAVAERDFFIREKVKPYRGGLLPSERRALEKELFAGKLNTIITTNALELGIDIGDMSLCILNGHPGSVSSFWQQAGRVGRAGKKSLILYIAKDMPIDQYIVHNKEFIVSAGSEEAWLSADNPYIIMQHIPCAAYEIPFSADEKVFSGPVFSLALSTLEEKGTLKKFREYYRYAEEEFPSKGVNLRGLTDYNVNIFWDGKIIGEIDPIGAMGTLYKDAIYQHLGKKFMSVDLDMEKKLCEVKEVNVDYFTEAVWESSVTVLDTEETEEKFGHTLSFGYMKVTSQPKLYKKIKEKSYDNIGYGPITLPPFSYDTMGMFIVPDSGWKKRISDKDLRYKDTAIYGLSYILKRTAPVICMGDSGDIQTDVSLGLTPDGRQENSLYLYDAHEGGVGYSEKIFKKFHDASVLALKVLEECECSSGCPACVPPLIPGIRDSGTEELLLVSNAAIECTRSILVSISSGEYYEPKVIIQAEPSGTVQKTETDEETERLKKRLERSFDILKSKRERIY